MFSRCVSKVVYDEERARTSARRQLSAKVGVGWRGQSGKQRKLTCAAVQRWENAAADSCVIRVSASCQQTPNIAMPAGT